MKTSYFLNYSRFAGSLFVGACWSEQGLIDWRMEVENLCKKHVMDQLNSSIQQQTCGVFVLFLWLLNIVTWCWLPSRLFCIKEKSIYATLNLFEGNMNLRASCWYPEEDWMEVDLSCGFNWFNIFGGFPQLLQDEDRIRATCIQNSSSQHGHSSAMLVPDKTAPKKSPPTYIKVNEFTAIFQAWNM